MYFELNGFIETTADLTKEDIKPAIEEALRKAEEALRRGARKEEEAARIASWNVSGKALNLTIVGTRFIRAHDALKRVKNVLADTLKDAKIGVRKLGVKTYVIKVPGDAGKLDALKFYPKVSEISQEQGLVKIVLTDLDEAVIDRRDVDRLIRLIQPEVRTIQKELATRIGLILDRSAVKQVKFTQDPTEYAEQHGWIARFPGRGQWYYLPPFAKLHYIIEDYVYQEVANKLGFIEAIFPKLIPIELAFRARKIQGEPGGMYYVCAPRYREKEKYKPFQILAEVTNELPMEQLKQLLEDPGYILDPVQCLPFYHLYRGKTLRPEDLPIKVVEAGGPTYRYEAGGVRGVERVSEFWRVEHVWLGTKQQVREIRDQVMERMKYVVDKIMDVEWRIQFAGDTFYLAEDQKIDEDVEIPDQPKLELQIWLPFRGPREDDGAWLACSSFNLHGNHYTKLFNIKCTTKEQLQTACFGAGITRLTIAFLAQHGFNPRDWPEPIREKFGEKVETLKGL